MMVFGPKEQYVIEGPVTMDSAIHLWNEDNPSDKMEPRKGGKFNTWYRLTQWLVRRDTTNNEVVAISGYEPKGKYLLSGDIAEERGLKSGLRFFQWRRDEYGGIPQLAGVNNNNPRVKTEWVNNYIKNKYDMNPENYPNVPQEIIELFREEYQSEDMQTAFVIKKKLNWWNKLGGWVE